MNRAESLEELEALRRSATRGTPYLDPLWQKRIAAKLDLESTSAPITAPKKKPQS